MKKAAKNKSSRSLVNQRLALVANGTALVTTTKKKPRGRPFEKGNKIGNRFKKGEPSANPLGRPKSKEIARSYRDWISGDVTVEELKRHKLPLELLGHSRAEVIAWVRGEAALKGDLPSGVELADRAEGRPGVAMTASGGADPMAAILQDLAEVRVSLYGKFEGVKKEAPPDDTTAEATNETCATG